MNRHCNLPAKGDCLPTKSLRTCSSPPPGVNPLGFSLYLYRPFCMKLSEEKKVFMLLKSVIFHYHGLDDIERQDLERTAIELDAHEEYAWAMEFIAQYLITAFDRARE